MPIRGAVVAHRGPRGGGGLCLKQPFVGPMFAQRQDGSVKSVQPTVAHEDAARADDAHRVVACVLVAKEQENRSSTKGGAKKPLIPRETLQPIKFRHQATEARGGLSNSLVSKRCATAKVAAPPVPAHQRANGFRWDEDSCSPRVATGQDVRVLGRAGPVMHHHADRTRMTAALAAQQASHG
jgi:hypothetical protein